MSQNHRYREQIDACRPGTGDLSLPALAELAQAVKSDSAVAEELARSERFDHAVSAAMHDVPLPAGLLERLEARLATADFADVAESTDEVALPPTPARVSRRTILATALSLAAVVLIAVGAMYWPRASRQFSGEQLANLSAGWFNQQLPAASWKPVGAAPAKFAVPREVSGATKWQPFTTPAGESGVVFDLTRGVRPPARLFVIATSHKYAVATIPFTKLGNATGNLGIGAWQRGGLLYVVVVDQNGQRLDEFVRPPNVASVPRAARPA